MPISPQNTGRPTATAAPPHETLGSFTLPERSLIRAMRELALQPTVCDSLIDQYTVLLGGNREDARTAVNGLGGLLRTLATNPRRKMRFRPPACPVVAPDERAVLALITACQQKDRVWVRSIIGWLLTPAAQSLGALYAKEIATSFHDNGRTLTCIFPSPRKDIVSTPSLGKNTSIRLVREKNQASVRLPTGP